MTNDEIRIKVAEAMGFTNTSFVCWRGHLDGYERRIPNYPEDLNACAEFEATLTDDEWTDYLNQLYFITFKVGAKDRDRQAVSATARQRCLAYLKTKGILS